MSNTAMAGDRPSVAMEFEFDGPDFKGQMSASQLATVLEGIDEYTHCLNRADAFGHDAVARAVVRDFDEGSFDFTAMLEIVNQNIPYAFTIGGGGFAFWWKYMRKTVESATHVPDRRAFQVKFTNGDLVEFSEEQWKLFNDKRASKAIGKITSPLRNGATKMTARTPWDGEIVITDADAGMFEPVPSEPRPSVRETITAHPVTVNFDPTKNWRLERVGGEPFSALIEDKAFIRSLEDGKVRVGKTDTFTLAIRADYDKDDKPKYFIERLIGHKPGDEQHALPQEDH